MPQSDNLEQLKAAGCLADDGANLSEAEKQVIDGLSKREVDTLIEIRQKLAQAQADIQSGGGVTAEALTASDPFQSNIIL